MPLHNIFKKTRKNSKPKPIPLIVADIHEKNSLVLSQLKKSTKIKLLIKPLKIADYIIGPIAIERKTISDLIGSMISKRLIQQLKNMEAYPKSLLIIEGNLQEVLDEEDNISKAIRGLIISISTNNTPIIQTRDYEETAKYLITLAKQQLKPNQPISLHSRIPKTKNEQKQYIVESFPNIGPKKAELLLKKFKTLNNLFSATEEEIKEILKNQTGDFKSLLDS
jgi:Fanconi anemia group M protein|tara:strand:+ start:328 stop:996 length:669 start_codon:yes stop_codon:yes gene_type:complete